MRDAIARRLAECGGLQLHPGKTRIVYCKDDTRRGPCGHTSFTFLGYIFRVRKVRARHGNYFFGFNPAISDEAAERIGADPLLAAAPAQWMEPEGTRAGGQHDRARVDQLLRAVLPVGVVSEPRPNH